jgi:putative membrane protein
VRGAEPSAPPSEPRREVARGHVLFRAPSPVVAFGLLLLAGLAASALFAKPFGVLYFEELLFVFSGPAIVAGFATTPVATLLGGRLEMHRGLLLACLVLLLELPLAAVWRGAALVWPSVVPPVVYIVPFLAGPAFWFRHLSLFGVSRSSHARMLPASLLQPVLFLLGDFFLVPPTVKVLAATAAFLLLAFVCALAVLSASDRPIRREFQSSGVSLIRPLLDHVGQRDPEATRALEAFFLRATVTADARVDILAFGRDGKIRATLALPTVHPGPFGALGSSDLPRKLEEFLGPGAGTVLVPHTPSDHDLDLPSEAEVERIGAACRELLRELPSPSEGRSGPLVSPYPGSLARAQILRGVALVLVSQAPAPTDDIAFSVADRITREIGREGGPPVLLVDAHNSYIEGKGDIAYGSPAAEKLLVDAKAAVAAARAAARDGPVEVGVAVRSGYSIGRDGIGPQGLRALVVRAGGATTGYVLIDGNNLVAGEREPIVEELVRGVDVAEVMTTDNHVVHEADGGINPVGERYPRASLVRDARAVLDAAVADLAPADVIFGTKAVPDLKVLGPGYTARLLTSLGDTLAMFTHMFTAAFLLLLTSSLVVALLLR